MKKQKYLAFMLSLSLAASCSVVNAQTLDEPMPVITNQVDETPIIQDDNPAPVITDPIESDPIVDNEEVSEVPSSNETDGVLIEENEPIVEESNETVPDEEPIEESIELPEVQEPAEILLEELPDDLNIVLPDNFNLEMNSDSGNYSYDGLIHIDCPTDSKYRVDIKLKDTNVQYVNEDGAVVDAIASLDGSDTYSLTYDEVSDGFDIPISIETEETELSGQFSTIINFSIDIYQLQSEVQEQPIDQEQTTEPDEQVEQPAEVDLPADPVLPVQPDSPVESELPEEPDSPVESELPEEPESSTDSQVPQTDEESADSQDIQESSNNIGVSDSERRE